MDLGNLVKTFVHFLIIGGMICLNGRDEFFMVSVVVHVMHIG